jgi:hypothetical protein
LLQLSSWHFPVVVDFIDLFDETCVPSDRINLSGPVEEPLK